MDDRATPMLYETAPAALGKFSRTAPGESYAQPSVRSGGRRLDRAASCDQLTFISKEER
jgi:hypothetical protein